MKSEGKQDHVTLESLSRILPCLFLTSHRPSIRAVPQLAALSLCFSYHKVFPSCVSVFIWHFPPVIMD